MTAHRILAPLLLGLLGACGGGGTGPDPDPTSQAGSISGRVTASGSGVGDVQISLGGAGTATSDSDGKFSFPSVNPGSYTLTVNAPAGYALDTGESASKAATVREGQAAAVSWTLRRTAPVETREIQLEAASFNPKEVAVTVGSTVKWNNATAIAHNITPNSPGQSGTWQAQNISGLNSTFEHTFRTTGQYDYVCTLHAGMTGTVKVQ